MTPTEHSEEAIDAVIEALWKLMRESTINFMPSPLERNKAELKRALYNMLELNKK